jgi:hypothetical protein
MRQLKQKEPRLSRVDFDRRAEAFLKAIQEQLMPEHAKGLVAIKRWPNVMMYLCRVDGGPATKFHGR